MPGHLHRLNGHQLAVSQYLHWLIAAIQMNGDYKRFKKTAHYIDL